MTTEKKVFLTVILVVIFIVCAAIVVYPLWKSIRQEFSPTILEIKENILVIPKIGVKIPIVEGEDESVLENGAWRMPQTSAPDKGSNTVIAGHRWKYKPPSEKTFYLLDELEMGDAFQIYWQGYEYDYQVASISIVLPTELDVLNPTEKPIVTLLTCHPLFSTEQRLIIVGERIR